MEVKSYRKKPVEIRAIQFDGYNWQDCLQFMSDELLMFPQEFCKKEELIIHTLEGGMKANIGDYIIRGVNGEFYPCKPDIFEKTYELAEDGPKGQSYLPDKSFFVRDGLEVQFTSRNFPYIIIKDRYDTTIRVQQSSSDMSDIWLFIDKPSPYLDEDDILLTNENLNDINLFKKYIEEE